MSSSYDSTYYQHAIEGQCFVATDAFEYDQYDGSGPKTPSSIVNQPRLSPMPLTTPPQSRNPSQPPEHVPSQMISSWEDANGSLSNSPASIETPDHDFDTDMVDLPESMPDFHQYLNDHERFQITPMTQGFTSGAQNSYGTFQNQFSQQTYNQVEQGHFPISSLISTQGTQHDFQPPQFNTNAQTYPHQPMHRDPWSSQRPPQNPRAPQSGDMMWDPHCDPVDYSQYLNVDVSMSTGHDYGTNVNYIVAPTDPLSSQEGMHPRQIPVYTRQISPHVEQSLTTANISLPPLSQRSNVSPGHSEQIYSNSQYARPKHIRLFVPSQEPEPYTFVNYDQNSSFLPDENFVNGQYEDSSPTPSSMVSSTVAYGRPPFESEACLLQSVPSPNGSEDLFSPHEYTDQSMVMMESLPNGQSDLEAMDYISPDKLAPPRSRAISEISADELPSPDPGPQPRRNSGAKATNRAGGRQLGTHLDAKVAKAAHDMRKEGACWHCVLQRDKCGPGEECERCIKRSLRPNADCGLGCSRVKLIELQQHFLPTVVTRIHDDKHLTNFVSSHIYQWGRVEITLYMTCGQTGMPRMPIKVYEFVPKGEELIYQIQYKTCPDTRARIPIKKRSPPLAMLLIDRTEERKYDKHIDDIVDGHLDAFGEACWQDDDNDFQQKLFKLMVGVKAKSEDERKLLREVTRLIVVTYIMSRTFTIAEETKHQSLAKMHDYAGPDSYAQNFTSPRVTNRQMKHFFNRLHRQIMANVLNKLQQILKSSKGCDKWLTAFIAVIGMAMSHEDQQKTIHLVMETKAATNEHADRRDARAQAEAACRDIDDKMRFITAIFRWKYNRKHNPLCDTETDWLKEPGFGDEKHFQFVKDVRLLVKENTDYLTSRMGVSISHEQPDKVHGAPGVALSHVLLAPLIQ